ncbi:hypothetical protein [Marinicellulosiphila megalodicopiae]|uniref:hypothetical protein n=1 Tax=Marinicellulosiphila megalodicopiae TaxID=2724896 RepID=UPI003BB0A655
MTNFNDLIDNITVNELKKRLKALPILNSAAKPTRKADIAKLLFSNLSDKKILTTLYKTLTPHQKLALQESVHNYNGYIDEFSFSSKYKQPFPTNTSKTAYTGRYDSIFSVFFYPERGITYSYRIPQDLLTIIKPHIELPPTFKLETVTQLEDDTLEVNTSINHIENDFNIFLNMMKLNKLKVSAKTGLPSKALLDNLSIQVNEPYNKVTNNGDIHLTSICSFGWIQILSTST